MYWRRFAVSSIPLDDPKAFEAWLMDRWREKDALLELFYETGLFPAAPAETKSESESESESKEQHDDGLASFTGYIETSVRLARWSEVGQIFVVLATVGLIANIVMKLGALFT
jgi:Acyltransferase C-terminus